MKITTNIIKKLGACEEGINLFKKLFGRKGIELDTEDFNTFVFIINHIELNSDKYPIGTASWVRQSIYQGNTPDIKDITCTNIVDPLFMSKRMIMGSKLGFMGHGTLDLYKVDLIRTEFFGWVYPRLDSCNVYVMIMDYVTNGQFSKCQIDYLNIGYLSYSIFSRSTFMNGTFMNLHKVEFNNCSFSGTKFMEARYVAFKSCSFSSLCFFEKLENVVFINCGFTNIIREQIESLGGQIVYD